MVTTTCPKCGREIELVEDEVRGPVFPTHPADPSDDRSRYCEMSNQEIGYD
jgi:hypothetical protein